MAKGKNRHRGTGTLLKRGKIYWWRDLLINGIKGKDRSLETTINAYLSFVFLNKITNISFTII